MTTDPKHQQGGNGARISDHFIRDSLFVLALISLTIYALQAASEQLIPIVLAVLLWFFINGIAHALRSAPFVRPLLPGWLAIVVSSLIVGGLVFLGVQLVFDNISELSRGVGDLPSKAARMLAHLEDTIGISFNIDVQAALRNLSVDDYINFSQLAGTIGENLSSTILVLLYVLFLLLDQPFYDAKIRALCPDPVRQQRVRAVLTRIGANTRAYVWIMTLVSIGVGLLTYAIGSYFGLAGAAFWGFLAFALNYIPTIGSFLGVLAPGAYAVLQFETIEHTFVEMQAVASVQGLLAPGMVALNEYSSLEQTFVFVVALGIVQFVMGNILLPRVAGNQLNLSQFVIILSLTIWGFLWGAAGLFLAVPIMMVMTIVLAQLDATRPLAILLSQNGRVAMD